MTRVVLIFSLTTLLWGCPDVDALECGEGRFESEGNVRFCVYASTDVTCPERTRHVYRGSEGTVCSDTAFDSVAELPARLCREIGACEPSDGGTDAPMIDVGIDTGPVDAGVDDAGTDAPTDVPVDSPDAGDCGVVVDLPANVQYLLHDGESQTFEITNVGPQHFHVYSSCTTSGCTLLRSTVVSGAMYTATGPQLWLGTDESTGATQVRIRADDCVSCARGVHVPRNELRRVFGGSPTAENFEFENVGAQVVHVMTNCLSTCELLSTVPAGATSSETGSDLWLLTDEATGATDVLVTATELCRNE